MKINMMPEAISEYVKVLEAAKEGLLSNEMPPKMPTLCKEGWICLGFWCFLLGVDKNGMSALRKRESEIDAFVRELRNEDAPSDLETWIESGVM
jgi:hypothetical protein